jgi:hypothetical protein
VQAIPAGSEVLISYLGEKPAKSSAELMKDYGFVLPGNTNDALSFTTAGKTTDASVCTPFGWFVCTSLIQTPCYCFPQVCKQGLLC